MAFGFGAEGQLFREMLRSKNVMIEEEANEYSKVDVAHAVFVYGLPTIEATEQALKHLDEDSALGPDKVPTRILKRSAHVLAPVLHMLIVAILTFGEWSALWATHWVVPLYKRKLAYEERRARDALAQLVLTWIRLFGRKR